MNAALLLLRGILGLTFAGHGAQKAFGWFGGGGIRGATKYFGALGYSNPQMSAVGASGAELASGVLLLLGAATPIASAIGVGTMTNAVAVTSRNGYWNAGKGCEYPLVLAVAALALAGTGPGTFSVDRTLSLDRSGTRSLVFAAAVGLLSGAAVARTRRAPTSAHSSRPTEPVDNEN